MPRTRAWVGHAWMGAPARIANSWAKTGRKIIYRVALKGSVKMRIQSCVFLPSDSKQNANSSPNHTQPGDHLLEHPVSSDEGMDLRHMQEGRLSRTQRGRARALPPPRPWVVFGAERKREGSMSSEWKEERKMERERNDGWQCMISLAWA